MMGSFERGDELSGSIQCEELLPSLGTISFSRRTLLHGVVSCVILCSARLATYLSYKGYTPIKKNSEPGKGALVRGGL